MIILCFIKCVFLFQFCSYFLSLSFIKFLFFFNDPLAYFFLIFILVENRWKILTSYVLALTILLSWVMNIHENLDNLLIRNYWRIKNNSENFYMASWSSFNFLIRRVLQSTPTIAWNCFLDSLDLLEESLNTPEASSPDDSRFHDFKLCSIDQEKYNSDHNNTHD